MTDLVNPVRRRSTKEHRGRRTIITLYPGDLLGFREERTRTEFLIPVAAAFDLALKIGAKKKGG
jgi:hypothetical protein